MSEQPHGEIHVHVDEADGREHITSRNCWCDPVVSAGEWPLKVWHQFRTEAFVANREAHLAEILRGARHAIDKQRADGDAESADVLQGILDGWISRTTTT